MKKLFLIIICFCAMGMVHPIFSQTTAVTDTFRINLSNSYKISMLQIVPSSEKVFLGNRRLSFKDYSVDYKSGIFTLSNQLNYSLLDTLSISYNTIRVNLQKEYKHRAMEIRFDEKSMDTLRYAKTQQSMLTSQSLFGKDLNKSGALIRGFTVGTNRDFTLNSGLRLQLSGKLSDDITLVAALSDENTPIQPEGNTETLDELDKVFIELKHKNAAGTFGDYELNLHTSEFSQISRKLQGLKGEINFDKTTGMLSIAGSRGKFTSNQITGLDGNQGPYRLTGSNNERVIVIISGSERVFVDGHMMKRGENNDYVIDYSNAEVTFTAKRMITSASRITIEFEYTDQKFKRNFVGADFATQLFDDKLKIGVSYFREGDDEKSPIDFTYTDEQLKILERAGNDRSKAIVSGISLAPLDSLGKTLGIYTKIDTLLNGETSAIYKYLPGSTSSLYNVSFSYVGNGNGDYLKESLGVYKYAGSNQGSYLPIIYIPMPELKQIGNFSLNYEISKGINLNAEISASNYDSNTLSAIDDSKNYGYARKIFFEIQPQEVSVLNLSLGKVGFSFRDRFIESKYSSLDRIDEVEFGRNYNISQSTGDQVLRELQVNLVPTENLSILSKYGFLKQGNGFQSDRFLSQIKLNFTKKISANYNIDYVSSTNQLTNSKWTRQSGNINYSFSSLTTGMEILHENKEERISDKDSLLSSSLRYAEIGPFIQFSKSSSFDARVGVTIREESFPLNGILKKQSDASTQQLQVTYRGIKEISSTLNLTFRNKKYSDEFKQHGFTNNETVLLLSQNRFNFWDNLIAGDLYYQVTTEQTARLEKVFVKVQKGLGNYIYLGDLNANGIPEENEFQLSYYDADFIQVTIPTDQLYPVIDMKLNTRWKIDFKRILQSDNLLASLLKPISTETFLRLEENNKSPDTKDIYLLNFSKFLDPVNTIRGTQQFQQDININQNNSELSFRLRFNQRKSLNQYSGGSERGFYRERTFRIRFKMVEEMSNQTDITHETDNMISPITSNRARQISRISFVSDFSYRPIREIEVGFKLEAARSYDEYPTVPATIDLNSFTLRSTYSFENLGRLRIELERTELTNSASDYNIPYEVLKGNLIGKNYFWRVYFDYRLSTLLQTSVSYDGRLQGTNRVIHTMRAEARAYF